MIYVLSAIVLLSPLLFTLLFALDWPLAVKFWVGLAGLFFLIVVPIVVLLIYGGGSLSAAS